MHLFAVAMLQLKYGNKYINSMQHVFGCQKKIECIINNNGMEHHIDDGNKNKTVDIKIIAAQN